MASGKNFTFICGQDDYLVGRQGKERFEALVASEGADEFSREIINGFAANVGEVETAVNQFRNSVQTVSMFGTKRIVWLKDVNFLADSVTGRAESTLKLVDDLQAILQGVNPAETAVLVTAAPVDRRRSFPKWVEKNADFTLVGGDTDNASEALAEVARNEAKALGTSFGPGALELMLAKVGANTRLIVEETQKLATYAGDGPIEEAFVADLTPNVAEGDFFEAAEAFFSGDLKWTLAALNRHFFSGGDARPIISALQNRNRILLQVRALVDAGDVRVGQRGIDGLQRAASTYASRFVGSTEKSSYNVFTQNPWYLGKLAGSAKLPSLRRLIDNQQEFIRAFEEIISRSDEQEEVLREMSVRCLSA
ncbi:DNA polymerase III subunit delta [Opitutus sp. ER46]|uniref:DNA polymerase III subunit delta n=1 Tax=Opitutus sp. ER46 TaxID=2161864 RepID=UPI000D308B56|nr:DNA polymerase III subunit delta [Opitutus sp. ER46]PTX98629.1 DNA polymerase III subunit delta [Opitutus sp. ER46]